MVAVSDDDCSIRGRQTGPNTKNDARSLFSDDDCSDTMALNVVQAFAKLAMRENNRERMIADGLVPPLVDLCGTTRNQKTMFQAAMTICYLCTRSVTCNAELRIMVGSALRKIHHALHGVMPQQLEQVMKIANRALSEHGAVGGKQQQQQQRRAGKDFI